MKYSFTLTELLFSSLCILPASVSAIPAAIPAATLPTIHMAGDSTMAKGGGGTGTEGWGQYLGYSFTGKAVVNNTAVAGRSARSYTEEGRFNSMAASVKPNDWVIIEFGHNDGGAGPTSTVDNGRASCPGIANETCVGILNGEPDTDIKTFPTYMIEAGSMFMSKGAKVIISSQTPDNPWETGTFTYTPTRFVTYAKQAATQLGAYYVDHGVYTANAMKNLGLTTVDADYPLDHIHTAPALAAVVAQAFVLGLKCGGIPLASLDVNATISSTVGTCV